MSSETPIQAQKCVELADCGFEGVKEAKVLQMNTDNIEFDRFMRLSTTAKQVSQAGLERGSLVLDVGGFDGALALFLPELKVWVVDPVTTGGSGLKTPFPNKFFEVVVSVDALEHLPHNERPKLLQELVRVTKSKLFINFPEARSMNAQKLVLSIIDNKFIKEHVEYELPTQEETIEILKKIQPNMKINIKSYVNIHTWMTWFILFHTNKDASLKVSSFLKKFEKDQNVPFLYDLLECQIGEKE